MIRVVLDANVLLSGLAGLETSQLAPAAIVRLWSLKAFELIISAEIINEVGHAVGRPYFAQRVGPELRESFLQALWEEGTIVTVDENPAKVATHPADDPILATAVHGRADYLVTGDKQLLLLRGIEGIEIVSPRAFLDLLDTYLTGVSDD